MGKQSHKQLDTSVGKKARAVSITVTDHCAASARSWVLSAGPVGESRASWLSLLAVRPLLPGV